MSIERDEERRVQFTLGPWESMGVHVFCDMNGGTAHVAQFTYTEPLSFAAAKANARLSATAPELREALMDLVSVIDAAGLLHLSNCVQLGAMSWYAKASDRLDAARNALAKAEDRS